MARGSWAACRPVISRPQGEDVLDAERVDQMLAIINKLLGEKKS